MNVIYYIILACSIIFYLYTSINVILIVKFANSLSTIMKKKYSSLARSSKIVIVVSLFFLLINFFIPQYLFKSLLLIISMFLNTYIISETYILRQYI